MFKTHVNLCNVIILGIGFLFIFAAFQTSSMSEQSVLEGATAESNGTFQGSGYISLATIYAVFAMTNWVSPMIVVALKPKFAMFFSAIVYNLFIASFLKPMDWSLYLGSVLVGAAAAVLWTAQGNFIALCSSAATIGRNSSLFWAIFQSSLLLGNLYQYLTLRGQDKITDKVRTTLYLVFTGCCLVGVLLLLVLREPETGGLINVQQEVSDSDPIMEEEDGDEDTVQRSRKQTVANTPMNAFKRSFILIKTPRMLLLLLPFAYTGIELTFFSGVYGTSLGHIGQFGTDAKSYIGLSGMFIGVGEIAGSVVAAPVSRLFGREVVVIGGYVVHLVCFFLIFLNVPSLAPLQETYDVAYIWANPYLAMVCAVMLGVGDSAFNTQIVALLSTVYSEAADSPAAFALFKFMQSLTSAAAFFYSPYTALQWQLLILVVMATAAVVAFGMVEWKQRNVPLTEEIM